MMKNMLGKSKNGEIILVLPALLLNVFVMVIPAAYTVYLSFTKWNGLGSPKWVGLDNFKWFFSNPLAIGAFINNIKWMFFFLTIPFLLALCAATLMYYLGGKSKIFQTLYYIPVIQSRVITAAIFSSMIFHPVSGLYGWLAGKGFSQFAVSPLTVSSKALWAVAVVDCWAWWGFLAVVFFSAMRQIEKSLIEAADIDGANGIKKFFHIIIPSIQNSLSFMFLMTIVWSLKAFDFVYMITKGGPGYSSELLATLSYKTAFENAYVGRGASVSMVLNIVASIFIFIYVYYQIKQEN